MGTTQDYEVAVAGGRDDRAPRARVLYDAVARVRKSRSRATAARPARRAATCPRPRPRARAWAAARAYSSATASGCSRSASSRRADDQRRHLERLELLEALEGHRARHHPQRAAPPPRDARGAPCAGGWPPGRVSRQRSGRSSGCATSTKASTPPASSPSASRVPVRPASTSAGARVAGVGGRDLHQRRHPLGVLEREGHRGGGAHRAAHQRGALELELVEHRLEVRHQVRVLVGVGRRRVGLAVAARVVGDQPVAALEQVARALHHVAARGASGRAGARSAARRRRLARESDAAEPGVWRKTWNGPVSTRLYTL